MYFTYAKTLSSSCMAFGVNGLGMEIPDTLSAKIWNLFSLRFVLLALEDIMDSVVTLQDQILCTCVGASITSICS